MENTRRNVIRLLKAMIKAKRENAYDLEDKYPSTAKVLWLEQNALTIALDVLENQRDFDDYAEIYFNDCEEENQDNG